MASEKHPAETADTILAEYKLVIAEVRQTFDRHELSEGTQHLRKVLTTLAAISLFLALSGAFPKEIDMLGVRIDALQRRHTTAFLIAVNVYFLLLFVASGARELIRRRRDTYQASKLLSVHKDHFGSRLYALLDANPNNYTAKSALVHMDIRRDPRKDPDLSAAAVFSPMERQILEDYNTKDFYASRAVFMLEALFTPLLALAAIIALGVNLL